MDQIKNIKIIIFEPSSVPGVGLAYQNDLDNLIINRPAQTMSGNLSQPDEFFRWYKKKFGSSSNKIQEDIMFYPSRKNFGYYLSDLLDESIKKAGHADIQISIVKDTVVELGKDRPIRIKTKNNKIFVADYILLATGNNQPRDIYELKQTPKYKNSPYPLYTNMYDIRPGETVGILGNSLTAIDVTLSLAKLGHCGNITMLSRSHVAPRVRSEIMTPYKLNTLTLASIEKIKKTNNIVRLRDILRLFRNELKQNNISWKQFFTEDNENIELSQVLANEVETAKNQKKWQGILSATNEIIENLWNALDHESKDIFLKNFQRVWLNNRSPIPPKNAASLLNLIEQKKLLLASGLTSIKYNDKYKKYIGIADKNEFLFDWIINATGPSRYIQQEDGLMHSLIQNGLGRHHIFGGIDVDFNTSALINSKGQTNTYIRVIGHNTVGVYNYTSSLEMILKRADIIAYDFINLIKEDRLHGQNKVACNATFDRLSRSA